jgi:hypothetical protein
VAPYPRLTRANIRAAVRELTAIYSTDIVSDARINDLINERLYKVVNIAEDLNIFLSSDGGITPSTVVRGGVTYRFPAWSFDRPGLFPTNIVADLYLESDSDLPPWEDGHYDNLLVYGAAADVLSYINDDSGRIQVYESKYSDIADRMVRAEYVNHNLAIFNLTASEGPAVESGSLALYTLAILSESVTIDSVLEFSKTIVLELYRELNALFFAYRWPSGYSPTFSSFIGYQTMFCYAVAATMAKRMGRPESVVDSYTSQYNTQRDTLLRQVLYSTSGAYGATIAGPVATQVRALLQDFTTELPEAVIYSWINMANQVLMQERSWPFLTGTANFSVAAGTSTIDVSSLGIRNRVLNVFEVRYNGAGQVIDSEIVYPVPHILDGKVGDAKYVYDINNGIVSISPTPTETVYIRAKFIIDAPLITSASSPLLFDPRFTDILAYRAAVIGSSWSDYGKKMKEVFQDSADQLFEAMVSFYLLDHSTEPLQIGGSALETRKYLPWFRTP